MVAHVIQALTNLLNIVFYQFFSANIRMAIEQGMTNIAQIMMQAFTQNPHQLNVLALKAIAAQTG